jgi:hypothetical protein
MHSEALRTIVSLSKAKIGHASTYSSLFTFHVAHSLRKSRLLPIADRTGDRRYCGDASLPQAGKNPTRARQLVPVPQQRLTAYGADEPPQVGEWVGGWRVRYSWGKLLHMVLIIAIAA